MQQNPLKRTKVRKGTHSCAECKRRKIKCDRTEYSSYTESDACSQCKARGLASSCKPQYDPRDAPSPEPDSELRDRVARLESALMSLTGRSSPSEVSITSPRQRDYVGTAVASGTNAGSGYYESPANLYKISPQLFAGTSTNTTPATAPYSQTISPFDSVVDPSLSIGQTTTCKWLEDNIPVISQLSNRAVSSASSSPYSSPENPACLPLEGNTTGRSAYEIELLSNLPKKELVDELISVYFTSTDVCHATFRPVFDQSYNKLWNAAPNEPIDIPFLGVLFIAMANAVHCHPDADGSNSEKARAAMDLYDRLSNQITEDSRYNFHIETVETMLLQGMFLLNDGKMNNSFLRTRSALAVAQMIGLHRDPKNYNAKQLQAERARRLWGKLYDMDRALSLFMGRPYTIIDKFVDVELPSPYDDSDISAGPDGEMIIDKSKSGKTIMYYRIYNMRVSREVIPDIIDNNYSLGAPDHSKVAAIENRLAHLAQTVGPGWNQLLKPEDLTASRNMQEQVLWMHRLASTFWTIQIHSCIHLPHIQTRPDSKAVCLENARSLMFLYECIRTQFHSPGIRNVVAFYGFVSAVFLETMSDLPDDKRRVAHLKEIFNQDSKNSTIAFQAAQVLEYLRNTPCHTDPLTTPSTNLTSPPPIILPYFGVVRIADRTLKSNVDTINPKPKTVALHPPAPENTVTQVNDNFYDMNLTYPTPVFGAKEPVNWDFNVTLGPTANPSDGREPGGLSMDIDSWSTYWNTLNETLLMN